MFIVRNPPINDLHFFVIPAKLHLWSVLESKSNHINVCLEGRTPTTLETSKIVKTKKIYEEDKNEISEKQGAKDAVLDQIESKFGKEIGE